MTGSDQCPEGGQDVQGGSVPRPRLQPRGVQRDGGGTEAPGGGGSITIVWGKSDSCKRSNQIRRLGPK